MNLLSLHHDSPELVGAVNEPPMVLGALARELINPQNVRQKAYSIVALIKHYDRTRRMAATKSEQSFAHAAYLLDQTLESEGIYWNGTFGIVDQSIRPTDPNAEKPGLILAD